jgi:hypothetical protein
MSHVAPGTRVGRPALPGLAAAFIQQYDLDPAQCVYIGAGPMDPGFARRIGFQYCDAAAFFAPGSPSAVR